MKYISTRGKSPAASFSEALFTGLAPDGGLYLPDQIPWFSPASLVRMKDFPYVGMATELIYPFVAEEILTRDFSRILNNSIKVFSKNYPPGEVNPQLEKKIHPVPAPLKFLEKDLALLELFHGPTLAFKDFALQLLAGLMDFFIYRDNRKILILGATSGDTGSAAIEAFRHFPEVKIVILHPHNRITPFQRRQMTATGAENVWNLAVEGDFDDCQRLVKDCFNSRDFLPSEYNLTAVNSINWARIMAQIIYYFSAFFQAGCDFKKKYYFTVPTGNFGNVLAGYFAKKMGLPIEKLIVAVNPNDILHRFFSENDYRISDIKQSYSPSMDILVPSNLERLLYLLENPYHSRANILNAIFQEANSKSSIARLMEKFSQEKKIKLPLEVWENAKKDFLSSSCNDEETLSAISECYQKYGMVIDPHTAVGLKATLKLRELDGLDLFKDQNFYNIILATAHPQKFSEAISLALPGVDLPDSPLDQKILEGQPEKYEVFPNKIESFKDYLLKKALA